MAPSVHTRRYKTKNTLRRYVTKGAGGSILLSGLVLTALAGPVSGRAELSVFVVQYSCLPGDVKPADPAMVSGTTAKRSMVDAVLRGMRARCRNGRLIDRRGRQIRFYHVTGCWGNPPLGYEEVLEKQTRELARLRKRYSVVEIPCDQGQPIQ